MVRNLGIGCPLAREVLIAATVGQRFVWGQLVGEWNAAGLNAPKIRLKLGRHDTVMVL